MANLQSLSQIYTTRDDCEDSPRGVSAKMRCIVQVVTCWWDHWPGPGGFGVLADPSMLGSPLVTVVSHRTSLLREVFGRVQPYRYLGPESLRRRRGTDCMLGLVMRSAFDGQTGSPRMATERRLGLCLKIAPLGFLNPGSRCTRGDSTPATVFGHALAWAFCIAPPAADTGSTRPSSAGTPLMASTSGSL